MHITGINRNLLKTHDPNLRAGLNTKIAIIICSGRLAYEKHSVINTVVDHGSRQPLSGVGQSPSSDIVPDQDIIWYAAQAPAKVGQLIEEGPLPANQDNISLLIVDSSGMEARTSLDVLRIVGPICGSHQLQMGS